MKKIVTLAMLAVATMSASAQETFNLFSPADCDADGWLWLNTQAKIDRYVGNIDDEKGYTVDPNGKVIQMAYANITPDYPETVADPDVLGADESGYVFGDEEFNAETALKGAIVLAPASAQMSTNGGCLVLNLPSCSTIGLYLSSEASMLGRSLMLTPGKDMSIDDGPVTDPWTGSTKAIYSRATPFSSLSSKGHQKWETVATDNARSANGDLNFVSDAPVYFALQNCNRFPIYVHAIRITTPKQETVGIQETITNKQERNAYYNLAGQRMTSPVKGINIIAGKKVIK